MPLSLLRNLCGEKKSIEAFVNISYADKQKSVFKRGDAANIQAVCQKHDYLRDIQSDNLRDSKTGEKIDVAKFQKTLMHYMIIQATTVEYIIPITAPVYIDGKHGEASLLRSCYIDALNLAKNHGSKSINIPLISSKVYGYPYEEAFAVAINAITNWLTTNDMDVSLLIFDKKTCLPPKALLSDINNFIDNHYEFKINPKYKGFWGRLNASVDSMEAEESGRYELRNPGRYIKLRDYYTTGDVFFSDPRAAEAHKEKIRRLREELGEKLDDSFSVALLELINVKGKTAVEVYKQANIDRKLFSKIRNECYIPGKRTTIALAVALELSLDETKDLLKHTGYTLSRSLLFDVIIEYFISRDNYDIFEINNVLFSFDQPTLGG